MERISQTPETAVTHASGCDCPPKSTTSNFNTDGYIDTHAHLFNADFANDLAATVERALASDVRSIILPAIDSHQHDDMIRTVQAYPDIFHAAIGVHPTSVNEICGWRDELRLVRRLLNERPIQFCAIGEVGLDMHWNSSNLQNQSQALAIQTQLAIEYNLPLILHVRDAWNAIFPLLEPLHGQIRGVFHSFQGDMREYEQIKQLGDFAIGIGGFITYKNSHTAQVLKDIPLENIVLETDAPYLTPVPFRGTRNESSHIPVIAAKIAEIKGVTIEEVRRATTARAKSIFFPEQ